MANEFKILVREAFNTAYHTYKNNKLEEGAKEKGEDLDKIDPALKSKADLVLNQIVKNPNLAMKYKWSPQGAGGLSTPQLNYVIDSLFELYVSTKDENYKKALSYIYSPFSENPAKVYRDHKTKTLKRITGNALHDILQDKLLKSTVLEQLIEADPEIFEELLSKSWGRMFAGGKIRPGHRSLKNPPVDYFQHMISLYKDTGSSNFGALIEEMLLNDVRNLIRAVARTKGITSSIDKPKQSTGKTTDLGDPGDEYEAMQSKYGSEIAGSEFEDIPLGNPEGQEKLSMTFTKENFNQAIREIIDTARAEGIKNEAALITLEEIAINHLSYAEIAEKHRELMGGRKPNDLLRDLVFKNKKFQAIADAVMEKHNLPSLTTADFQWIFKHGKETVQEPAHISADVEDDDSADYVWEEFVGKNLDQIMERVYKRLQKNLNN